MDWNKENKLPPGPGDKTGRRSAKAAGTGAEGSGGQPFNEGAKEKKGLMRRIFRGGGERALGLRNTPDNVATDTGAQGEPGRSLTATDQNQTPAASAASASLTGQQSNSTQRAGGARKKNFVKANMLAAASAKNLRSTTHLERQPRNPPLTPGGAGLANTSSRLGGSARSLNSEPGSGREETGKTSRNPNLRKSFHFGKASRRPRETLEVPRRTVITRKSISEAPEILVTPPVSSSARQARGVHHGSTSPSLSFRAPARPGPSERDMIASLTARLDQLQLVVEELRNDQQISLTENQRKVAELAGLVENNARKHAEDLKNVLEMNKCQLESQRLEFKEEIRKLLSFKDSVPVRTREKNGDQSVAQPDTFKNTSDRLLNKIHRLSARMSLQDSDMKELIQVKSCNEKKLDSAKKNPLERLLNVPDLQSCNSQSEPDLAGM